MFATWQPSLQGSRRTVYRVTCLTEASLALQLAATPPLGPTFLLLLPQTIPQFMGGSGGGGVGGEGWMEGMREGQHSCSCCNLAGLDGGHRSQRPRHEQEYWASRPSRQLAAPGGLDPAVLFK